MGSILGECPLCHKKQATKNKTCKCGLNLDDAKKSKKIRYWISYRMPDGKQRRESVSTFENLNPHSIKDARDALSKREVQKKEKRLFDMLPESQMTFRLAACLGICLYTGSPGQLELSSEQCQTKINPQ